MKFALFANFFKFRKVVVVQVKLLQLVPKLRLWLSEAKIFKEITK